ncbi:MAG: toll/interleukin-1 receptor domain-containing protein [Pseudomonadota bacterium]|jgi:hypothetical protein
MQHDVFICHASEDKDRLVRPLAEALREQNIDVWYDEFSMKVGDSLRQAIDRGLAGSRFGVVVLSHAFFAKPWTNWELNGLVTRVIQERRSLLLPIWHGVGPEDVTQFSPPLADIRALLSKDGVEVLCINLMSVLRPSDSPLIVAKVELARFGWDAPPISDEWWLDMVESQNNIQFPTFRRPWLFPLPGGSASSADRGRAIAWTALQMSWQEDAERLNICQTTRPEKVLAFIADDPALAEACAEHPDLVANYAPQLLIPSLSGLFAGAFDKILSRSEARIKREPDSRYPKAICEKRYALRRSDFGGHAPRDIADKWVSGRGGDQSAQHRKLTDYIFWLLSADSNWLPNDAREVLTIGMRDWAAWAIELTYDDVWDQQLAHEIYGRQNRALRWTKPLRRKLERVVEFSLKRLDVQDDTSMVAQRFVDLDFVGAWDDLVRQRRHR